jgi:hypothetical protein
MKRFCALGSVFLFVVAVAFAAPPSKTASVRVEPVKMKAAKASGLHVEGATLNGKIDADVVNAKGDKVGDATIDAKGRDGKVRFSTRTNFRAPGKYFLLIPKKNVTEMRGWNVRFERGRGPDVWKIPFDVVR